MQTLHVRSVPEELYSQIRNMAQRQHRSLSAQVVVLLEQGLAVEAERLRTAQALARVQRRRFVPPTDAPDSTSLLREDRER